MRWLRVRLQHLPPESATMTALRNANPGGLGGGDPSKGPWSQLETLIGSLVNEVRLMRHEANLSRVGKGQKAPKQPELIPLPGAESEDPKKRGRQRRKPLTLEQADWLFDRINGLN